MKSIATVFSGGGGVEIGALQSGFKPIWGIERDLSVAKIYRYNIGDHLFRLPAEDVSIETLARPKVLWASPPCQNASTIRRLNTAQVHPDAKAGDILIQFIEELQPDWFFLENVPAYRFEESFQRLTSFLHDRYNYKYEVLNAADYGVAQHRKRLILAATTTCKSIRFPDAVEPQGWFSAIEDIWREQIPKSLPNWLTPLIDPSDQDILIDSKVNIRSRGRRVVTKRSINAPSFSCLVSHGARPAHGLIDKIRQLSPRAWARLQSFPDSYKLPYGRRLALKCIGNAVPPQMAKKILDMV